MLPSASVPRVPYYIHAPHRLDEGTIYTAQLHALCHYLNMAGYPAYLVGAPMVHGPWWTPILGAPTMAAHYLAGYVPLGVRFGADDGSVPGLSLPLYPSLSMVEESGLQARLQLSGCSAVASAAQDASLPITLPWFDTALLDMPMSLTGRSGVLVYSGHLSGTSFKLPAMHQELKDISPFALEPVSDAQRWQLLSQAEVLYAYAGGRIVTEAKLLGCKVVYVHNDHQLRHLPQHPIARWGACLNTPDNPLDDRPFSAQDFRQFFREQFQPLPGQLRNLVQLTQDAAAAYPQEKAWSARQLATIETWLPASAAERAVRADALAVDELCRSYAAWQTKAVPTEVFSDVCAELVASGRVRAPVVHIFAQGRTQESLADALDQLGASWLSPARIVIHSDFAAPFDLGDGVQWVGPGQDWLPAGQRADDRQDWVILLEAGTRLEPYALIDLLATAQAWPECRVVHAAHDAPLAEGKHLPHFTGGLNLELLRGTNYLGGVAAVRASDWLQMPDCARFASLYRLALRSSAQYGPGSVHYVDKVLSHAAPQMAQGQEAAEFSVAQAELQRLHPGASLRPSEVLGCWQVNYPEGDAAVTLIIPTGKQAGYLRSLLLSCVRFYPGGFREVLLVVQESDQASMEDFIAYWPHADTLPLRLLCSGGGAYSHARSLNLALAAAATDWVLVCDDDVEWLDAQSLPALRRFMADDTVAVVAPRLVLQQGDCPLVTAGPQVAGEDGLLLNYVGRRQGLNERGLHNRLQMAQDVAGVHGSCWLARRRALTEVQGLDEEHVPLLQAVADLGYRLQQAGWRMVWTPQASVMHYGGATLRLSQGSPQKALQLAQARIDETRYMRDHWVAFAGQHRLYSKHLSGRAAYVLDTEMVNVWSEDVRQRPRVLALPLHSGSGQYRVIEPLHALQMHSLAETCVIEAEQVGKQQRRALTPLDVARFRPDRIVVQHSILDQDIAQLRAIREAHPQAFIVQLMDDLSSELPPSHPNFVFGQREGHTRTLQALALSDRLIVSTQPLADYYAPYCQDIRLMPNALDMERWEQPQRPPVQRSRLRIGWVGAAQHLGDLRLVRQVVQQLAERVDWVFMGMCPDELRPFIKEFHNFVSYRDYPATMASLDLDIAIAPLENHTFNACKSNLRLLEYGAMGWPVICSDVYPYRTDDPPVMRVSDDDGAWLDALQRLMGDAVLRRSQGQALRRWLLKKYTIKSHVDHWYRSIFDAPVGR